MIRSVAFNAPRSISVSVQIPVAVDPLAEGEVADAFAAALFLQDAEDNNDCTSEGCVGREAVPGGNL
jgi:hypothetical protein